jgi:hypothetical protein
MKTKLAILATLGALPPAFLVPGCTVRATPESVETTQSAIEGGDVINLGSQPVSSLFPLSTVGIVSTWTDTSGVAWDKYCTGEILSSTTILTAAHCKPNKTTKVFLYPSMPGAGALPLNFSLPASQTVAPAVQPGVVCDADVPGSFPSTCYSTGGSGNHYADLAVVTLAAQIPGAYAYHRVVLGPSGSFTAGAARGSWAVGTGQMDVLMNWCNGLPAIVGNASRSMQWVPMAPISGADSTGLFMTTYLYADEGDSGGPVYQEAKSATATPQGMYNLVLVGVISGTPPTCVVGNQVNTYTSVENADNHAWLLSQGATDTPDVATFGASLTP